MMNRLFEIPYGATTRIEVVSVESQEIDLSAHGISERLLPAQPSMPKDADPLAWPFVYDRATYQVDKVGQPLARVVELGCLRGMHFGRLEICVRDGKGRRDRVTMLPKRLLGPLRAQLEYAQALHRRDLGAGFGRVYLPEALARKYLAADREWIWQWVFPARRRGVDPRTGEVRRHHVNESSVQRAVKHAVRASGVQKAGSCHTLRHHANSWIMPRHRS